ncbi:MAG: NUDIX domain-containing protein [Pseudomonadota bacterium]
MSNFRYCPVCAAPLVPAEHGGRQRLACSDHRCQFVHWGNPTPVVAAIAERNGGIVQVRSHGWPEGFYGLVTGFLEAGESAEDGVLREVREETGLPGTLGELIGVYPFFRMNQILIAYHVELADGEIVIDAEELDGYREVALEDVRPWASGTGYALRDWLAPRGFVFADDELISLNRRGSE